MNLWKTFLTKFDKSSLVLRTLVICLLFLTVTSNSLVRSISISNLCASSSEALRMVEQGGVRIDGETISDKGLKVEAGTFVLQVGKRKFARVTLA
jgi:tyrosyl-tRNA synthetase